MNIENWIILGTAGVIVVASIILSLFGKKIVRMLKKNNVNQGSILVKLERIEGKQSKLRKNQETIK